MNRSLLLWCGLAALGFTFWAIFVLVQREWTDVRARGGFVLGVYILYWKFYPGAFAESEPDSIDE